MAREMEDAKSEMRSAMVAIQGRLRRFAYGLCGNGDEADDLVQSAYERALSRLDQWQPGTRLDSWMFRILQSIRFNRLAADKVRGKHFEPVDPDLLAGGNVDRELEAHLTLAQVRDFLWTLPEDQRSAMLLVAVEGMSYKEAAEVAQVPVGTITSRLSRARRAVIEHMDGTPASPVREIRKKTV